jgi:hypothetical protein
MSADVPFGAQPPPPNYSFSMNNELKQHLGALTFGQAQTFENITILPIISGLNHSPEYLTLGEAVGTWQVSITETSQAGTVPELLVTSIAEKPVLLLDGEELAGAKQNRVLNTTILLREKSQTRVPVSCTESGRWSYTSKAFAPADLVMEKEIRARKSRSVSEKLASHAQFASNQGEVWSGISALHAKAQSSSPTSAMSDAFKAHGERLDRALECFPCRPGQRGLFVFVNGRVAGFDVLSRPEAYAKLHPKLLRSYLLHGLLAVSTTAPLALNPPPSALAAHAFLAELETAQESKFQSLGYGWDVRLNGERIAGSALMHEGCLIHGAFFRLEDTAAAQGMASFSQRRRRFGQP